MTMRKRLFRITRRLAALLAVLACVAIAILSLMPGPDLPGPQHSDKFNHFIAYAVLAFLASIAFAGLMRWYLPVIVISYGCLLEVAQGVMPYGREASIADVVANLVGVAIGGGLGLFVTRIAQHFQLVE